jgi:hypothetical protein
LELINFDQLAARQSRSAALDADCLAVRIGLGTITSALETEPAHVVKGIDGMVAIIIALARALVQTKRRSVHEDRGVAVLGGDALKDSAATDLFFVCRAGELAPIEVSSANSSQ